MEVIVNEDQLSLAIGKRGQNVRLATKLVGWNIDIRSEEEIKREVTEQMGALIASGEAVPLSVIEGVTAQQAEALAEHGINDIDALAQTTVDDLVEFLDLSLDEAEVILEAARAVIAMRDRSLGEGESVEEQHAVSAEFDESIDEEVQPSSEMTADGYDEAVENGVPFQAEQEINAWESADPVSLTEAEPIGAEEIALQEAGRDLRPDTITPSPDITSSGVEAFEHIEETAQEVLAEDEEFASEAEAEEAETSTPAVSEEAASGGSPDDDENY
jgi:N utilization substance protein A